MMRNTNHHPFEWLGAYLDGELSGSRLEYVTAHLEGCAACRSEVDQLRSLSQLLQEVPAYRPQVSAEQQALQVKHLLPREIPEPGWRKTLDFGWKAAPAVFVAGWAFFQAVLIVAGVWVTFFETPPITAGIPEASALLVPMPWSLSLLGFFGGDFLELPFELPDLPSGVGMLFQGSIFSMVVSVLTVLMLASWVVSRWAFLRHQQDLISGTVEL